MIGAIVTGGLDVVESESRANQRKDLNAKARASKNKLKPTNEPKIESIVFA